MICFFMKLAKEGTGFSMKFAKEMTGLHMKYTKEMNDWFLYEMQHCAGIG